MEELSDTQIRQATGHATEYWRLLYAGMFLQASYANGASQNNFKHNNIKSSIALADALIEEVKKKYK